MSGIAASGGSGIRRWRVVCRRWRVVFCRGQSGMSPGATCYCRWRGGGILPQAEWYVARGDVVLPLARQWYSAAGRVVFRAGHEVVLPRVRQWYSAAGRVVFRAGHEVVCRLCGSGILPWAEWYVARGDVVLPLARRWYSAAGRVVFRAGHEVVLPLARQWYSAAGRVVCRPGRRGFAACAAVVFCRGQSGISCGARSGMPLVRQWYSAMGRVVWLRRGFAPGNAPMLPHATVFYAFAAANRHRKFENCSQFRLAMIA